MARRIATRWICWSIFCWTAVSFTASDSHAKSLVAKQKWLRLVLRQGRVCLIMPKGHTATLAEACGAISENLAVDYKGPVPRLRYERHTGSESLYLQFFDTQDFLFELERGAPEVYRLKVRQSPGQPVHVEKLHAAGQSTYQGATFWHLCTAYPHVGAELIACFEVLRSDWYLARQIELVERQLHASLPTCNVPHLQQCIEQLASASFAERETAYRQLKSMGACVLPMLMSINVKTLTAEQRVRIEKLRQSLQLPAEDSPAQAATWLVNDPQYWLQRASTAERADRHWAQERWQLLMGSNPATSGLRMVSDSRSSTDLRR